MEEGRERSPGGELEPDGLPDFLGQNVKQGVVCLTGGESVCDILVRDCKLLDSPGLTQGVQGAFA